MPINTLGPLAPLAPLTPLTRANPTPDAQPVAGSGFAQVLQTAIAGNAADTASADAAITALATGQAQDLHTVSLAVAQADLSFRTILELRNRLTDAFQEIARMQV